MARRGRRACLAALALLCVAALQPGQAAELVPGLSAAEAAQAKGQEPAAPVVSNIVEQAGAAVLPSGDGDVDTTGACAADIKAFCDGTKPGEGRLAACLSNQQAAETAGTSTGRTLSPECGAELRQFKIDRAENINLDLQLATACKADADTYCKGDNLFPEPGAVLTCLREVKDKLSAACSAEVFRTQLAAAEDFAQDAMLHELCTADAERLCKDVPAGGGRVQACLRDQRPQLSWDCQEELFRQEVENADDLRLSSMLFRKCARDKSKFCAEVQYGNARVKDCLEDHKDEPEFSAECRVEFEAMMARRASDFRLDAKLREACAADIDTVCGYEKDSLDSIAGYDGRVVECLQDYKAELQSPICRDRVHVLTARAAADIRMDRPLAEACAEDANRLCEGVEPGGARVLRCLEDHGDKLSYECRATLFDQEVRLAEDIDFQVPMKQACAAEVAAFCKEVPNGNGRVIQCLVDHDEEPAFSAECHDEVKRYEIRAGQDYRLQFRLHKACAATIDALCENACSPFQSEACGGTVLACLVDKREQVSDEACARELFEYERSIANDERVDAVLAAACAADVTTHCADVEPGMGRVHACLRDHAAVISRACATEELKLEEVEASDVRLKPGFARDCAEEMAVYCRGVAPGKGRMFRCLQNNVGQTEFSAACKSRVAEKQARAQVFYNLDYGLRTSCAAEVDSLCAAAKNDGHGKSLVIKCLAANVPSMANKACQAEVGRALRTALFQYRAGAALTEVCDADVTRSCRADSAAAPIGSVGRCLARLVANATAAAVAGLPPPPGGAVDAECAKLVEFAVPRDPKSLFDDELQGAALTERLAALQAQAAAQLGATLVRSDGAGGGAVTLTGWFALLSAASLVVVVTGAAVMAYRKYMGLDRPYTLVVKGGDL